MSQQVPSGMQDAWKSCDALRPPEEREIQVWRLELDEHNSLLADCMKFLTAEEAERVERRRAGRVREEFAVGRACLRLLLSNVFSVAPCGVTLLEGPYGKPWASVDDRSVSFNVTHSRGVILVALGRKGNVGIDVERIDPAIDVTEIAKSAFSASEVESLTSIASPEARRLAFYRCWTQKEAVIKADGRGLSLPLSSFDVPILLPLPVTVEIKDPGGERSKRYFLSDIPLNGYAVGAIATDSHNCRITWLNFPLSAFRDRL